MSGFLLHTADHNTTVLYILKMSLYETFIDKFIAGIKEKMCVCEVLSFNDFCDVYI